MSKRDIKPRIYFGPFNIGHFSSDMAKEMKSRGYSTQWQIFYPDFSQDDLSTCLFLDTRTKATRFLYRVLNFLNVVRNNDIFVYSFLETLLPFKLLELKLLRKLGKKVIMLYVGSELRVESLDSFTGDIVCSLGNATESTSVQRSRLYYKLHPFIDVHLVADPTIFPSPKMYPKYFPIETEFRYFPLGFDIDSIPFQRVESSQKVSFVHIPSTNKIKGTEYVMQAFSKINNNFPQVETRYLRGLPHNVLMEEFRKASVIVDTISASFYGTTSKEGMALGKPVIGKLGADILEKIRELHPTYDTPIPPLVPANHETIYDVLVDIIQNPKQLSSLGAEGRYFVEKYHSLRVVGDRFEGIISEIWK